MILSILRSAYAKFRVALQKIDQKFFKIALTVFQILLSEEVQRKLIDDLLPKIAFSVTFRYFRDSESRFQRVTKLVQARFTCCSMSSFDGDRL